MGLPKSLIKANTETDGGGDGQQNQNLVIVRDPHELQQTLSLFFTGRRLSRKTRYRSANEVFPRELLVWVLEAVGVVVTPSVAFLSSGAVASSKLT